MNPEHQTHALYRFYDTTGTLLYVGITADPGARWRKHAHGKPWWHEITQITIETHPTRAAVLEAERAAIITEKPRHNIVHNSGSSIRPTVEQLPAVQDEDQPDECQDCLRAGWGNMYYPYRWRSNGQALYQCVYGHRWTCWWGHSETGEALGNRGLRQMEDVDLRPLRRQLGGHL